MGLRSHTRNLTRSPPPHLRRPYNGSTGKRILHHDCFTAVHRERRRLLLGHGRPAPTEAIPRYRYRSIFVPEPLCPRLLALMHYVILAGHIGQNKMCWGLRRPFYWPHMAADARVTVRNCYSGAGNCVQLRKHPNRLMLFPAFRPLHSAAIDIL